jgi:hypothetical protein
MRIPRFLSRPWFSVPAFIMLAVGIFLLTRKSSYQRYEEVKIGDPVSQVSSRLGDPIDTHHTVEGTDYLYSLTGHPDYPRLLGVPFPVHRIIRVRDGRVISKGPYEDYYDPYSPGWTEKKKEPNKSGYDAPPSTTRGAPLSNL